MIKHLKEKRQIIRLGWFILCLFSLSLASEFFHQLVINHSEHFGGCSSQISLENSYCNLDECHESCQICQVSGTLFKVGFAGPAVALSIPLQELTEPNLQQFAFITSEYFFPFPLGPPVVS